ncbi:MAG: endonuclease MutS2 [Planctomycetota bacterium]
MTEATAHALRVLEYERIREVLSSYATSSLGKAQALSLEPCPSAREAAAELARTEEMRALIRRGRLPLAGVRDVLREFEAETAQGRAAGPGLLYRLVDLLEAAKSVREVLARHASALPELAALASRMDDLPDLREAIVSKIDAREGVRDDATERLSALRRTIRDLRDSLRSRASRILAQPKLRAAFQTEGLTVKDDRYLLPVKAEYRSWVPGPIRDRSQSGATLYVEPEEISLDGDRLLEALDAERDEAEVVLWDLTRRALAARETIRAVQQTLGRMDFIHAKAAFAEAFGLASPAVADGGALELVEVRHPYLLWLARGAGRGPGDADMETARSRVVPIDVRLGDAYRILVVTGPNTGGKTVALKTIGLTVLMALSGVPVAAREGTKVPWFSKVFADIGDEQSIEQSLSTFSAHLQNIIRVVREADEESLVLLDELGAGTDPLEGAALGRALLDTFLAKRWTAVITTHLGNLKEYAYTREGVENAAMEFDPKTLRPTYRMLLGVPGSSNALAIARRMGLDPAIVGAAEAEIAAAQAPTRDLISRMERSRRRAEKELRRAERVRRRAQGEAREYRERLESVEAQREALLSEADRLVEDSIRKVRETIGPLVERLRNVPKTHRPLVDKLAEEVERLLTATPVGEKREAYARSLKKDDFVYVPKFREKARVRKVDKADRKLTVLLNGILVEIGFDDVSWLEGPPAGSGPA